MSATLVGVLGLLLFLILLMIRVPVGIAMLLVSVVGYGFVMNWTGALARFGADAFSETSSYNLSVIPLFILMGMVFANAGLGRDVYTAADVFLRRIRGGLAIATLGASAGFGAVSGSAVASATTMSMVAYPEMERYRYSPAISSGAIAVGGTLGILIPPSSLLVLYGVVTEESIGAILLAAVLPGIMTTILLMLGAYLVVRWKPELAPEVSDEVKIDKLKALVNVWPVPIGFGISMGGLYAGFFTPTEAAAVGAFIALLYGLASRRLSWEMLVDAVRQTTRISAMIFLLVIGGKSFGYFLTVTGIPRDLGRFIANAGLAPWAVLASILIVYLVLGALMDEIAMLVILTPVTYPLIIEMGYSGVWFGVISIMAMMIGLVTPPVGLISFVVSGVTKLPLSTVFVGVTPFWIVLILAIVLVMIFPDIATVVPALMG